MNRFQSLPVCVSRNPPTIVDVTPARLPIRFIVPETDSAYFRPASMHDAPRMRHHEIVEEARRRNHRHRRIDVGHARREHQERAGAEKAGEMLLQVRRQPRDEEVPAEREEVVLQREEKHGLRSQELPPRHVAMLGRMRFDVLEERQFGRVDAVMIARVVAIPVIEQPRPYQWAASRPDPKAHRYLGRLIAPPTSRRVLRPGFIAQIP